MKPLLVIVGETASGKSDVAMRIAESYNGEIVAADSTTVYKDFNIGTAKPSLTDRRRIPHHMIDIAEPADTFTVATYKMQAERAINEIKERGSIPIMAGGTGLYVDSVLFDYTFAPEGDPALREQLEHMSIEQLLKKVEQLEIDADAIDTKNKRRLIRLIETGGYKPTRKAQREDTLIIGLQPDRGGLRRNIVKRTKAMFDTGLVEEVTALYKQYGWDIAPMQAIGYREFKPYFLGSASLEEVQEQIVKDTLILAKKQRTWFRRNKSIHWCNNKSEAVDYTTTLLNKLPI